jgi:hypothetical protein
VSGAAMTLWILAGHIAAADVLLALLRLVS